jgi:hypothetical protein
MHPNFDLGPGDLLGVDSFRLWDRNDVAMHIHVYTLSGEEVTSIPIPQSYYGDYGQGAWVGDQWICLHHRTGHIDGNFYSLFVNVENGQKRLIGRRVAHERATPDGRFLTFVNRGILHVNFRAVYPMYGDELPDFGEESAWKEYREKYFVRKAKRAYEQIDKYPYHYVYQYEFTPDWKRLVVLDKRSLGLRRLTAAGGPGVAPGPEDAPAPELVLIELEKIEATNRPSAYSEPIVLPKDRNAGLERDDARREFRVWAGDGRTILWHRSFDQLRRP